MDRQQNLPPVNTRWIMGNRDLPQTYAQAQYRVMKRDGGELTVTLSKRKRQVVEALSIGPVYCASPVRLSDIVGLLRHEHGITIETDFYEDSAGPISRRFGVYSLADHVTLLGELQVAA